MAEMDILKLEREPTHPGEMLRYDFIDNIEGLTQSKVARLIDVGDRTINEICNKKRGISVNIAIKLSRLFDTTPDLWISMQKNYDLWKEYQEHKKEFDSIKPYKAA